MRTGADLDQLAEASVSRYAMLLGSFEGILGRALSERDWRSTRARDALRRAAYERATAWLESERRIILDAIDEIGEVAVRDVENAVGTASDPLSDMIQDHLAALAQDLEHELRLQIERDSAALVAALRDAALRSVLRGRGAPLRTSRAIGALRDETLSGVAFTFLDRAGRRWISTKFTRTAWRRALVLAGAEAALMRMSEIGLDMAVVTHPDRVHENSGRRVALTDGAPGEPWSLLREEVFHPNTHARLEPVLENR